MDMFDLASQLFGGRNPSAQGSTITATGSTASADGVAGIVIDADVTPAEGTGEDTDQTVIDVPTSPSVAEGDELVVTLVGEGPLKTPIVMANPGSGDRMQVQISNAETLAQQAEAVATATGQYFWHDENGAHVTEAAREDWETSQTGPNSLWNSLGMLFRDGLNNLMAVLTSGIAIYDGNGNTADHVLAEFASDEVRIGGAIPEDGSAEAAVRFFDSNADKGAMLTGYVDQSGDATQQTQDTRTQLRTRTHDADMPTTYGAAGESGLEVGQWLHAETGSYSTVESTATLTATADSGTDPTQTAHASASLGVKAVTVNDSAEEAYLTVNGNDVPMEQAIAALTTPLYENSGSVAITTTGTGIGTLANGPALTLPAGTYVIVGEWAFNGNGTAVRTCRCVVYDATASQQVGDQQLVSGNGNYCKLQTVTMATLTTQSTIRVRGGCTTTCTATTQKITAVRLS